MMLFSIQLYPSKGQCFAIRIENSRMDARPTLVEMSITLCIFFFFCIHFCIYLYVFPILPQMAITVTSAAVQKRNVTQDIKHGVFLLLVILQAGLGLLS